MTDPQRCHARALGSSFTRKGKPLAVCSVLAPPQSPVDAARPVSACTNCHTTASRLQAEFGRTFTPTVISAVLGGCLADLSGTPAHGLPELSERLAHYRLIDAASNGADGTSTDWVRTGSRRCPYTVR